MTRLTVGPGNNDHPVWSPDGRQIAFRGDRDGTPQIYRKDSSGTGQVERLTGGPNPKIPLDWSHDGRYLLYEEEDPKTKFDIWALPLQGKGATDRQPIAVLRTQFNERDAQFSPDSKWIAYESDESGNGQIYIQPFPPSTGRWQVSNTGGIQPRWRSDGKEIYFHLGGGSGNIWSAGIRTGAGSVDIDPSRELMVRYTRFSQEIHYDVTRDGQRFLEIQPLAAGEDTSDPLTVVTNWQSSLRQ